MLSNKIRLITSCGFVAALAVAGCGDDDPSGPPTAQPEFISASVAAGPANVISAEVTVVAMDYESVQIRVIRDAQLEQTTPAVAFDGDTVVAAAVLGLHPESNYALEILMNTASAQAVVDTLDFTTGPLPDWLPDPVGSGDNPSPGFVTLSPPEGPAIAANDGHIVWYLTSPDSVLTNFQAHPDGTYTVFGRDDDGPFRVYDELGRQIDLIGCIGWDTRFHEVRIRANGDYWVMCDEYVIEDLTQYGGNAAVEFQWTVLQHIGADGALIWEWKASEHFDVTDVGLDVLQTAVAVNATHGNSIAFDTDGNVLVSFRNLSEVTKIEVETGIVMWRLGGGLTNEFTFIGDAKSSFERQHGLRVVSENVIQLLDNGDAPPSRMVRYRIDPDAKTATLIMEYIHSSGVYTRVGGGTDVMDGGGGLVSFGQGGVIAETSSAGVQVWELLNLQGLYVFRTQRIPSLYASERTE